MTATEKDTSDLRKMFEHWMSDEDAQPRAIERSGESYQLMIATTNWRAWQACARALQPIIDALQKELDEQCRLNGMGSEREAKLLARVEGLERLHHADSETLRDYAARRDDMRRERDEAVLEKNKAIAERDQLRAAENTIEALKGEMDFKLRAAEAPAVPSLDAINDRIDSFEARLLSAVAGGEPRASDLVKLGGDVVFELRALLAAAPQGSESR